MVTQFTSGVSRRLGPSGSRWLQVATHWGSYVAYLEVLIQKLGVIHLPGLGEVRLDESFVPLNLRPWAADEGADNLDTATAVSKLTLAEALETDPLILLIGPAGTGKSALLRWHAIEAARAIAYGGRRVLLAEGGPPPLPVYIPLAHVQESSASRGGTGDAAAGGVRGRSGNGQGEADLRERRSGGESGSARANPNAEPNPAPNGTDPAGLPNPASLNDTGGLANTADLANTGGSTHATGANGSGVPLEVLAAKAMEAAGLEGAVEFLDAHLTAGRTLLLFDDLDTLTRTQRAEASGRISELIRRFPGNQVVVATRDGADREWLPDFRALEVAGVDPTRVETLMTRWGYAQLANASGFFQAIERCPLIRSLVARPGWLTTALGVVAEATGRLRAFDIAGGFVHQLDRGPDEVWPPIALAMHEAGTTIGRMDQVPADRRTSGLIQWVSADEFRFVHPAVQVYFAAIAAAEDPLALVNHAGKAWWDPLIVVTSGYLEDPRPMVEAILERGRIGLTALALAEMRTPPADLRTRVQTELLARIGRHGREADRITAVELTGLAGTETVSRTGILAPVLELLEDGPIPVRNAAAQALARLADPAAIAPLLTALGDPDEGVRMAASEALAAFGDRTVQPLVRQLMVPDEAIRKAASRALAHQGTRAVAALIPLLDAALPNTRTEAADALAAIGPAAIPALVAVLREAPPEGSRSEAQVAGAEEALTKIGQPAATALLPLYAEATPAVRRRMVAVLAGMGPGAVEALSGFIRQPEHAHTSAAVALMGELVDEAELAAPHLVTALADPRFEVRWEARRSLRRLGAPTVGALRAALDGDNLNMRWEAAEILLNLPNPPVDPLVKVLTELFNTQDVTNRRRAIRALGTLTGTGVRKLISQAIHDPDPQVRRSAIDYLQRPNDREAVALLKARWPAEEDSDTAVRILEVLTNAAPIEAIGPLLDGLAADDERLRREAADLLMEVGEPAVVPLIERLNAPQAKLDLEGALRVLDRASSAARAGGQAPANLARTYHRMLVEPHDLDELIYLATTIEWWPPALELHRTFETAREFLEYKTLSGLASAEGALEWVEDIAQWLRPAAGTALRQLRMISQAVQYYNRGATRRAKEKGLLAAADRLNTLRSMIPELGDPHTRVFHAVAEHWSSLVNAAIRELQGKANLDLEIRTEYVRIRDVDTTAVLVFELVNRGEGLASNIQLTLNPDTDAVVLQSAATHYLPPLGQGDRIAAEFTVQRSGSGVVPIGLVVRYDDPQKGGQTRNFTREVRFVVEDAPYVDIGTSPYIAGPPVKTPEMFYGRQSTFTWIQENLSGTYQDNVLVLYGERRTGKTSVLYQLQYHLPDTYAHVLIDLQSIAYSLSTTSELLYTMARKATNGLRKLGFDLDKPDRADYEAHPIEQFESLGETIGQMATTMGRRAVLIADEFDLLIEAVEDGRVSPYVFDCIRGLMQHQEGLSFIFAGAHKLTAMLKNPHSILFNTALRRKVSFLDPENAERLIRQPVAEVLSFDELAVEKILRATAGQPYFIQYICHELVNLARRDTKNFVALRDVDRALQTTVQETTGIIRNSYMSLDRDQQLALAALARITDDGRPFVSMEDLAETVRQDNLLVVTRDLFETLRQLTDRDFITERGGDGTVRQYGFAMDLVRVWLEQNDEYARLVEEMRAT